MDIRKICNQDKYYKSVEILDDYRTWWIWEKVQPKGSFRYSWHKRKLWWISTIDFNESDGKRLKAFFEPTGTNNSVRVDAEWTRIENLARGYLYAEQALFSTFQNWPRSLYSPLGNNCHTFSKTMIRPHSIPNIRGHLVGNDSPQPVEDRWNGRVPVDDKSKLGPHP